MLNAEIFFGDGRSLITSPTIEFVDTRTAFADLPEPWRDELLARDYVASHHAHSSPRADDDHLPPSRHRLVQWHLPSDCLTLYLPPNNQNNLDGLPAAEAAAKLAFLRAHATGEKYVLGVPWRGAGDLLLWDNTCTLHRAAREEPTVPCLRRCAVSSWLRWVPMNHLPHPPPPFFFLGWSAACMLFRAWRSRVRVLHNTISKPG